MRKKLTLKRLIRVAIVIMLFLAATDLLCETAGLPRFAIRILERKFADRGFRVSIGDARVGVINGIHLDDLVCYDAEIPDLILLYAQRAHASLRLSDLFKAELTSLDFTLESGHATIPLNDPAGDDPVAIKINLDRIKGFLGSERLIEVDVNGRLFSKIGVDVDFAGALAEPEDPAKPFTMNDVFDKVPAEVIRLVRVWRGVASACNADSDVQITNRIRGDLGRPESVRMEAKVRINRVLYNGIMIEQFECDGQLGANVISLSNLSYRAGETETCHGHATVNLATQELTCEFEGALFPRNLLRSFYPESLSFIQDLRFHKTPPRFKLSVPGWKIGDFSKLEADLRLDCRDASYLNGDVRSLYGNFSIKKDAIQTDDLHVVLAPNVDVFVNGGFDLQKKSVFLEATLLGDPLPICKFCPDEDVNEAIQEGFEGFKFSPLARPKFDVEIAYTHSDQPTLIISGTMKGKALTYNDVLYDSLDARVLVDVFGNQVVIEKANVLCNGAPAMTQIALDLTTDKERIDFDAMSNLDSRSLMRSIWSEWENVLTECGFVFRTTPFAKGSGMVDLSDDEGRHVIHILVDAPRIEFYGIEGENVTADLILSLPKVTGSGTVAKGRIDDLSFDTVAIDNFNLNGESVDLDVSAAKAQIDNAIFLKSKGHLAYRPEKPITIKKVAVDEVQLNGSSDVMSSLHDLHDSELTIHDDGRIQAKAHAKTGMQKMSRTGRTIVTTKDVTITNLALEKNQLTVRGTTKRFDYVPMKASAKNGQFNAYVKDNVITATLNIPELSMENESKLANVEVVTTTKGGLTEAGFQIETFKRKDLSAHNISGKIEQSGEAYKVTDGRCELVRSLPIEMRDLKATALSAFNTITISLKDGSLGIIPKNGVDKNGEKRYPINIDDIKAEMIYKDDSFNITKFAAPFYGGQVLARARTDVKASKTDSVINLTNVKIDDLLDRGKTAAERKETNVSGLLTATAGLQLDYADELKIFGLGKAKVRKATLYKIPILSDFLGLLKTKAGKISELDCDLHFEGDRLDIVKLETDGKLVSIRAEGHYWWKTEGIDMRFQADILKSWVFQKLLKKRLFGSLDDYKWEDWTAVYDIFRRKKGPIDPTLNTSKEQPPKKEDVKNTPSLNDSSP